MNSLEEVISLDDGAGLKELLSYVHSTRGFDFSAYKRKTLERRIQKRMKELSVATYLEYIDLLEVRPGEFQALFNTILINVTGFFRDGESWEFLKTRVLPSLTSDPSKSTFRIWVAGCASGEEAYSIAILLSEELGLENFRRHVKIYATDLDEEALAAGRAASFTPKDLASVSPELQEKYFEKVGDRLVFDREHRRNVIFGRHDLIQDAPISKVDLVLCRNTLMYFNSEVQARILQRFHYALNDSGILFLGKAEGLASQTSLFCSVTTKHRIFQKLLPIKSQDRTLFAIPTEVRQQAGEDGVMKLKEAAFESDPMAQLVVDNTGKLSGINERARHVFGLTQNEIGRPFQELEISYRPAELRSVIDQVIKQKRVVVQKGVQWSAHTGETFILDVRISPLFGIRKELAGTSITFIDVTQAMRLQDELVNFNQELETAYEEVQSTNEELQTTNEELQSTIEELETTNEELQSGSQEWETVNQELRSTNEELETLVQELNQRGGALHRANSFLESVLSGLREGVIVLDQDMMVLAWNGRSEDAWGVRTDEAIGKHLFNLDVGLPVEQLKSLLRLCASEGSLQETEVNAINRRGKSLVCRVRIAPLFQGDSRQAGVIILTSWPEE